MARIDHEKDAEKASLNNKANNALIYQEAEHRIGVVGRKLRSMMPWLT